MKEPTSLRGRIIDYLERNPHAELTREQIASMFHRTISAVDQALTELRKCGAVETVKVSRLPKRAN